jgi:hypothetical protein
MPATALGRISTIMYLLIIAHARISISQMEELGIQVDNPLQFLPQDKVGEFSNMNPVELLKHTEMAIGPEVYQKHLKLIDDDKELEPQPRSRAGRGALPQAAREQAPPGQRARQAAVGAGGVL